MLPLGYTSKLAEFADFASRAKMPSLPLVSSVHRPGPRMGPSPAGTSSTSNSGGGSQPVAAVEPGGGDAAGARERRGKLGVVEDMPHAATAERRQQLAMSLRAPAIPPTPHLQLAQSRAAPAVPWWTHILCNIMRGLARAGALTARLMHATCTRHPR